MERSHRWRIPPRLELSWRAWDGREFVVYHGASGDTHLLDSTAANLLLRLKDAPSTAVDLSPAIGHALALDPDEAIDYTLDLLNELRDLSLIELAP